MYRCENNRGSIGKQNMIDSSKVNGFPFSEQPSAAAASFWQKPREELTFLSNQWTLSFLWGDFWATILFSLCNPLTYFLLTLLTSISVLKLRLGMLRLWIIITDLKKWNIHRDGAFLSGQFWLWQWILLKRKFWQCSGWHSLSDLSCLLIPIPTVCWLLQWPLLWGLSTNLSSYLPRENVSGPYSKSVTFLFLIKCGTL